MRLMAYGRYGTVLWPVTSVCHVTDSCGNDSRDNGDGLWTRQIIHFIVNAIYPFQIAILTFLL